MDVQLDQLHASEQSALDTYLAATGQHQQRLNDAANKAADDHELLRQRCAWLNHKDIAITATDMKSNASWLTQVIWYTQCAMHALSNPASAMAWLLCHNQEYSAEDPILRSQSEEVQQSTAGQQSLCRAHLWQEYDLAYADRTLREQTEERTLLLDRQKHRMAQFRDVLHCLKVITGNLIVTQQL